METVKDKIQRIKFARMSEEHRFVAHVFSDLVPHKVRSQPGKVYFLKDDIAVLAYDKKTHYMWCHYDVVWTPFQKIVSSKIEDDGAYNINIMKHMREILGHFALAHFDISGATISLAHSFITEGWKNLKFRRAYSW